MAGLRRLLLGAASVALFSVTASAQSISMAYCATINTASTPGNYSQYQSDGLCTDFCSASYAFAIVKGSNCWCSDYQPADSVSVDTGDCNDQCPGFPSDTCGGDGLWGYMSLSKKAAGTKGGTTTSPTATSTQTAEEMTEAPTTESTTTAAPSPSTSIATVTADGTTQLQTITVMPTFTATGSPESSQSTPEVTSSQTGLSTGAAVGVAVGVLGFVVILAAIAIFFWLRRRRNNQEHQSSVERSNSGRGSSAGMMSTPRTEMASIWDSEQMSMGRRNSRLMPHDPRMDPFAGGLYHAQNKSRESINTLQDNQDYSRKVLRTTNPDPPNDE